MEKLNDLTSFKNIRFIDPNPFPLPMPSYASIPCAACQQGIPRRESFPIEVKYKEKGVVIYVKPHIAKQVHEFRVRYGNNIPIILEEIS